MRETYLYEADQSATMAGAIMRRMLLVGWDSSYLFLFLVEDNNVIILYIFPIQLLEYQTDVRRCRFDKNLAHCSARTSSEVRGSPPSPLTYAKTAKQQK